jgi:FkbM family methyltransferase
MDVNKKMIALANPGVFFDIGANHGMYCKAMSDVATQVYAFEPHPDNLKILNEAVADLPNVTVEPIALSDSEGQIALYCCPANPGGHSIAEPVAQVGTWSHSTDNSIEVATMTLDAYCEKHNIQQVSAIKIDVEGAEQFVLQGAKDTLKKNTIVIALETHQTIDLEAVYGILKECGYRVYDNRFDCLMDDISYDREYICTNDPSIGLTVDF